MTNLQMIITNIAFPPFRTDVDPAGVVHCATSAWSIRAASTAPAMAAPGSAYAIRTGVAYYAIKVSDPR